MTETALDLLRDLATSPWLYLLLFALAALDGVLPVVPGETALITAAVFAGAGESNLAMIILAGTAGAVVGDHASYLVGRLAIARLAARRRNAQGRAAAAYAWVNDQLERRGGQVLLASRYVPGVRTATTLMLGGVRYPLHRFTLFDLAAATFWAGGWSLIGYVSGATFENRPLIALAVGLGVAAVLGLLVEPIRRLLRRRSSRRADATPTNISGNGDSTNGSGDYTNAGAAERVARAGSSEPPAGPLEPVEPADPVRPSRPAGWDTEQR